MHNFPKTIQVKDYHDPKYNYDLAFGNLFLTVGKGRYGREVVDVQMLPNARFAKVTLWSHRAQREFSLMMGAWEEMNCTWLTEYEVRIEIRGHEPQ